MNRKFTLGLLVVALMFSFSCSDDEKSNIWKSGSKTFTKASDADWTLAANQDKITSKTIFTRQDAGPIYNYKWFQDEFGEDADFGDICHDFWDGCDAPATLEFTPTGGTQGIKWAILEDTDGVDESFTAFGELGKPDNFYSFHNIATILTYLEDGYTFVDVEDVFNVNFLDGSLAPTTRSGTYMPGLVGKKLGVWLVEENIYFYLTFTQWGSMDDELSSNAISYTRTTK
jgi:hypothetical protein